jgi:predicted permease
MAHWTAHWMTLFAPAALDSQTYAILDRSVLGFAVGIALLSGLVFGVIPALTLGKLEPSQEMVSIRSATSGVRRLRTLLITLQAALTLVLLAGTFALGRAFVAILNSDIGIGTQNVIALTASLDGTRAAKNRAQFYQAVAERLRAVPGVEDAGAIMNLPLQHYDIFSAGSITLDSGQKTRGLPVWNAVGPGLFSTLNQPFLAGRDFSAEERNGSQRAIIVNEEVARNIGLGSAIVGHRLAGKDLVTVVGVVRAARAGVPGESPESMVYRPIEKSEPPSATFAVRVRGEAAPFIPILRDAARSVDPSVPFHDIKLMDTLLAEQLARPRFYTYSMAALGAFALLLSVIGIYAVATHSIAQRTKEIGIRIAVGATPTSVRSMVLRQSLAPLALGLLAGIAATLALGKSATSLLSTAESPGPALIACTVAFLLAATAAAAWRATSRVIAVDPMQALRTD